MIQSKNDLKEFMAADKKALGRKTSRPSFNDVIWKYEIFLRKCEYYQNISGKNPISKLLKVFYKYKRFKLGLLLGYSIPLNTCGKGLCLAHIGPVVISNYAIIGENCRIHICVNIGADARDGKAAPHIGNNVYIAPGAKLFGNIFIADNCAIGANAVVNKSFLTEGCSIAGVPAQIVNMDGVTNIIK